MSSKILMPALSPTMEFGTVTKWYINEGDEVSAGEILADIETDKATMEFEAVEDGKIIKLLVSEGTKDIKVNSPIAEILLEDEVENKKQEINPISKHENAKIGSIENNLSKSNSENRIKISPLAKRIAKDNNIETSNIKGSGPYGRIIRKDLINLLSSNDKSHKKHQEEIAETNYIDNQNNAGNESLNTTKALFSNREYELIPINNMRKIVANRLREAKKSIPHFYLRRSIQTDKLIKLRSELNSSFEKTKTKFSINDFIIRAAAKSLQDNPRCNAIWAENDIIQLKSSDISVAVAIDDGLITPIIFDAEKKGLQEISLEMKDKIERAKNKKLLPDEYTGGSFSISNLGMMGIENFDAIINPPQASILAVGSSIKKPLVDEFDNIYVGHMMSLTLSADHRVIDGAVGATFINSITEYLANPLKLLI